MMNVASQHGIYSRSVTAGKWVIISNLAQRALSIVTFLVLARLLAPRDYGIMAVVFMITGFIDTISSPGFEKALMQKQGDTDKYLNSVWSFNFFKSIFFALILFASAPFLSVFFHIAESVWVLKIGALFIFLPSLANSRVFYFFKELDFKKIFFRDIAGQLAYIIVALSWIFFVATDVWALLFGHLARYLTTVIMTYVLYPYRQKIVWRLGALTDLFGYSKWAAGQNLLDYTLGVIDGAYVGRFLGSQQLGFYSKARDLSFMPVSPFFTILDKVSFPAYAKIQDELSKLQEGFRRTFDVVIAVTVPIFLLFLTEGGFIISFLFGSKWLGMVVALKILSAATILSSLVAITKPIFDAVGRPDITFKATAFQVGSLFVLLYVGAYHSGMRGVAFAMLLSWVIVLVYVIFKMRHVLRLGLDKFVGSVVTVGVASFVMAVYAVLLHFWQVRANPSVMLIVLLVIVMVSVYIAVLWLVGKRFKLNSWHTFVSVFRELKSAKKA